MNRSADEIIHHSTEERSDREETWLGLYPANIINIFFLHRITWTTYSLYVCTDFFLSCLFSRKLKSSRAVPLFCIFSVFITQASGHCDLIGCSPSRYLSFSSFLYLCVFLLSFNTLSVSLTLSSIS
jgi:hypothetical protein